MSYSVNTDIKLITVTIYMFFTLLAIGFHKIVGTALILRAV